MKWNRWVDHPRWLAALTLVFALVPAWLAVVTWRDARAKDERLFQTSAQVLTEQLQRKFDEHLYFPGLIRNQAGRLDAAALAAGQMVPAFEWKEKLPHLIAFGYAELDGKSVIMRWKSEERAPVSGMGADLAADPAVADKLARRDVRDSFATCGVGQKNSRLLVLMAVRPLPVPRGYVVAWLDLDSFCRHSPLTLLKDEVLSAASVEDDAPLPADTVRAKIHSSSAKWMVDISRGPRFSQEYGAPAPWLAFMAAGLSAVPLLALAMLAGRSAKLGTALTAEQELLRQQRYFTQSVSHEFRTPLGIILSGTDLLDRYAAHLTPERRNEVLTEIRDNTRHMSDMVERILLLGRMESGRLACAPAPVNVRTACGDIARKVMTAAPGSSITVTAPDKEAALDAALLGSILDNLLSNAVKYSAPGQPVTLSAAAEEKRIVFTVRDEGIGIPPEDLPRVCDPFHRCGNVGDVPGTGLGLAIAQRCAALHGGTLKIESTPGHGTTATVTIPLP